MIRIHERITQGSESDRKMYKIGVDVGGSQSPCKRLSSTVADILYQGRTQMLSSSMLRLDLLKVVVWLPSTRRQLLRTSLQRSLRP
jgi:hypothetical protein